MNWKTVLSAALVWSLAVGLGQAQQAVSVEGMVTDTSGGVLPGARVEANSVLPRADYRNGVRGVERSIQH